MKKQDLKKLIKEDITEWLKERNIPEAGSGDMAYTEKAEVKEKIVKIEDQIAEFYYVTKPTKESAVEEIVIVFIHILAVSVRVEHEVSP